MKRAYLWLLLLILLLAAALRFYGLDSQSLWNDEGTSVAVAQRDLATIARDAAHDIHPPLYYWLLSGWVRLLGTSEAAVRALSALLGVALVALTYGLGRLLLPRRTALTAALLAAVNPFQVYYSQEARMYLLLATVSAGAVLALVHYVRQGSWFCLLALALLEAAGLYTHYSFVFMALVLNLAFALSLRRETRRRLVPWAASQVAVGLIYLPWLPVAVRQVGTWPGPAQLTAFLPALADTWRWLVFGPTVETGRVVVPLLAALAAALLGVLVLARRKAGATGKHGRLPHERFPLRWPAGLLCLWLGLPVVLMFALGLYREAYLKFLLVTTPVVSLLLATGLTDNGFAVRGSRFDVSRIAQVVATGLILVPTSLSLRNYYTNPAYARDNYRAIAAYVEAVGRPGDAIVLNAPGQGEVFRYYYHGSAPIYPLPESRPLDPTASGAALAELAQPGGRVFTVLWATDESDPDRFVEGWLDTHAYKALDSWYGHVRLAVYAVPERAPASPDHLLNVLLTDAQTGDQVTLVGYSLLNDRLAGGDIAQISLYLRADRTPTQRYKVFLHVLDAANHIVGQRDAEPGGGARLTTLWSPGEVVADNAGVPIHPATPPGTYRVEAGMYEPQTGRRLTAPGGATEVWLDLLTVDRPPAPAPVAALGMQHAQSAWLGELSVLGYDAYRLGFAHAPQTPLRPGDLLHVALYWRAPPEERITGEWQVELGLVGPDGKNLVVINAEPVAGYPTSLWQAGDVWRGQYDLPIPADAPTGWYRLRVQRTAPAGGHGETFLSEPLRIGP